MATALQLTEPAGGLWELGGLLRAERERQELSRFEVSLAIRHQEDRIRFCEIGPWPSWKALPDYIEFLSRKAGSAWLKRVERAMDGAIDARLDELGAAGRLTAKALMLKACRGSSVGRALAEPNRWLPTRRFPPAA